MKVLTKYCFIFDPERTWRSREAFENDLGKYFVQKNIRAEVIQSGENKDYGEKYILLSELPQSPAEEKVNTTIKAKKAQLTKKRGYDGKFKKRNE